MLELLLGGHITTDMQAGCQTGDHVSLSNSTATKAAHPCSPNPNVASRCTVLDLVGGWGEEGDAASLLLELCHLFGWQLL